MKKVFFIFLMSISPVLVFAQKELRIHHINVDDGDATLIGIFDNASGKYVKTILIDGGSASPSSRLVPYLKTILKSPQPKVDFVALTHYHEDHYNGLLALANGSLRADSVIDQGGYEMGLIFPAQASLQSSDQKPAAMKVFEGWKTALKQAVSSGFVKGHATNFFHYGASDGTNIGNKLFLGDVQGTAVTLECVAAWGNSLNGNSIVANPSPSRTNANNFTLAFVLNFGQFRYFLGGDLGGDKSSPYIDQETPLSSYFAKQYPSSWSWNHIREAAGHICGFKSNHHGSEHSNTKNFINNMSAAISVVSAGKQKSWKLPRPTYLNNFLAASSLSVWTSTSGQTFTKGLYATNLFDFVAVPSKTVAIQNYVNKPGISFSYGNPQETSFSSYMVKVEASAIAQKSQFQVYKIDSLGASSSLLANYFCHTN
jgi:beta-lactamase superfamily II metal-dependent hydrolase